MKSIKENGRTRGDAAIDAVARCLDDRCVDHDPVYAATDGDILLPGQHVDVEVVAGRGFGSVGLLAVAPFVAELLRDLFAEVVGDEFELGAVLVGELVLAECLVAGPEFLDILGYEYYDVHPFLFLEGGLATQNDGVLLAGRELAFPGELHMMPPVIRTTFFRTCQN